MTATNATATAPTTVPLNRTEAGLLQAAAADEGRLTPPVAMKPATHARLLGRFMGDGLVIAPAEAGGPHRLTPAGYRAIGLAPPKPPRAAKVAAGAPAATPDDPARTAIASKKAQVLALLKREQGATLAELIAATGWLPHTTRAALSRIRTGGQALLKAARPDDAIAYCIPAPVIPAAPPRARKPRRTPTAEAAVAAAAAA
ncbi:MULTISPECIES: DUF3489 domain-containing protein [unclassified Methylobacterium]|uniref:DUF3489 domain-containing protein n=1 Tax=unclassified Methylobacterium TaxID=2615210 RepID=UPI0011C1E04D|nr:MULTISPECIES: DUF3489 domain-containing protein [unclassified Methylobacterium]MCJ2095880.1 DUF3489 domain-containing protein [Methylobacterium sp. J-072]QEE41633.1 DUF3489 domain-containing protein [Methylobacterium sp. WL1]TXN57269.1 DUF3489 domain-containing protein [Methylobacterium sp. WL2]